MRTTGIGRHRRSLATAVVAAVALAWVAGLTASLPAGESGVARAETPSASPAVGGDTRSPGQGPGIVGSPALAVFGVLAIGLATAGLTLLYLRLTGERGARGAHGAPGAPGAPGSAVAAVRHGSDIASPGPASGRPAPAPASDDPESG